MNIETISRKKASRDGLRRVAAYCRVSDDSERLLGSLASQTGHYRELIPAMPDCTLVGVYSDEAVTGTKADRPGFTRLLSDCDAGLIDVVLCKSISRFSRNTVDFLKICRRLSEIYVDFRDGTHVTA